MKVRFGILGTGVVGKTIAARLAGLGHEVVIGTREPAELMSRTEPDAYDNPPFSAWQEEHARCRLLEARFLSRSGQSTSITCSRCNR